MARTVRNWFGNSSAKLPWDGIAELRDVPLARARWAYDRAGARLRRSLAWWAGFLGLIAVVAAAVFLGTDGNDVFGRDIVFHWLRYLIAGILTTLAVPAFFGITERTLRRFIGAELGTHCWQCDYDLRGTPDAIPPAVARCPECGRVIPRNVHRMTIDGK